MTDPHEPFAPGPIVRRHLREASRHIALADQVRGIDDEARGVFLARARLRLVAALATIDLMLDAWDQSAVPTAVVDPLTAPMDGATIRIPR